MQLAQLISLSIACAASVAAVQTAPDLAAKADRPDAQVRQAALAWLSNYARQHDWHDVRLDATVIPASRPVQTCNLPYDITPANTNQLTRLTFSVRCPTNNSASYYQVRGSVFAKTVVASTVIRAHEPIDANAVGTELRNLATAPDALVDPAALAGKVSQRMLRPGQIIRGRYLEGERLVTRDQPVQIVAHVGLMEISTAGVALQDGAKGDVIPVRSGSMGKIISASVTGHGTVEPIIAQQ
ncbi:flagellar basal body P-ring formation chaperone FlgA [Burkholderia ubonensis]|uniref:flagellar basal body P-ring formation chaperone FlgA n=1 Tax=Burkholderia ubonensis TaxID=101571 RepID=UPI0012FBFE5A|nr:flagellar basal body P-ring formation chaperone FlgA [Burkholderia ubonensis]